MPPQPLDHAQQARGQQRNDDERTHGVYAGAQVAGHIHEAVARAGAGYHGGQDAQR